MRFISSSVCVLAAVVLAGCGTTRLSGDVKPYVGRDIHELESRLDEPPGRRETDGRRTYVWSTNTTGDLATSAGYETTRPITVQYSCTLEVVTDAHDIIERYQIDGSNAGCAAFRRQLVR